MRYVMTMIAKGLAYLVSHIFWWPAYFLRGWVRKHRIWVLWIWLDDETDQGDEYWLRANNLKPGLWSAIRWSLWRNNSFNLNYYVLRRPFFVVPIQPENKFRWEQLIDGQWVGDWKFNTGGRLDQQRSRLGSAMVRWEAQLVEPIIVDGKEVGMKNTHKWAKFWRYTFANFVGPLLVTLKMGWNERGEAYLDLKLKRNKPFYTAHWT